MSNRLSNIVIFMAVLCFAYLGQSLIKYGLRTIGEFSVHSFQEGFSFFLKCALNPYVIGGTFIVGIGFAGWVAFLSRMDLSQALPLMSLSYIPWLIIGYYYFDEPVGLRRILGVILITAGVALIG